MPIEFHVHEQGQIDAVDAPFISEAGDPIPVNAVWPVRCYLIRHPQGDLLWDTGLPEGPLIGNPNALGGMPKYLVRRIDPWLATFGLSCDSVPFVGLSHLHIDHGGNANSFPNSTFLIAETEYRHATSNKPGGPYYVPGYDRLHEDQVRHLDSVTDVFGDGTLIIHPAPGHSPGHQVLQVSLPGYRPMLLMGDASYVEQDLIDRRAPIWNSDLPQTFQTMDHLKDLATRTGATMLFHHDPDAPSSPTPEPGD